MFFGSILGASFIGGHNVAMPAMLQCFGFTEGESVGLATPGTVGAIAGLMLYSIFLKGKPDVHIHLQIITLVYLFAQFYFWFSFSLGYKYTYFGKFFYSIWNGPQIPLITDILIRYFTKIGKEEYILVGTSSVGLLKHLMNAVSGTYVGYIMKTKTQSMSWLCECTIMYAIGISFFANVKIEKILVDQKLNIYETESEKEAIEDNFIKT